MIDYCRYRLNLFKLRWQESHMHKAYAQEINSLRQAGKPPIEIEAQEQGELFESRMMREEISILITDFLIGQADKRFLPLPEYDDEKMWEACYEIRNRKVLTNLGITTVRSALWNDRKERIELLVKVLAAIIGILGALTGLFAVIQR